MVGDMHCRGDMYDRGHVGGVHGGGGGACVAGGHAWQERRPLQRTVRILLECLLVVKTLLVQFI